MKFSRYPVVQLVFFLLHFVAVIHPGFVKAQSLPLPEPGQISGSPPTNDWTSGAEPASGIRFEHITDEHGLSQNAVFCTLQDRQGFMWFGTQDGLNRYDGYNFTVFRHNPDDSASLSDNYVTALYEGRDGKLWIGTQSGGLNRFDPVTETFSCYRHDPENPGSLSDNHVTAIQEDSAGLWIGTFNNGLNRLNRKTATGAAGPFTRFLHEAKNPYSLGDYGVNSLLVDRTGALWIGTYNGGLNRYDRATGNFTRFVNDPDNPNSLSNNYVLTIFEDAAGALWLGMGENVLNKLELSADRRITEIKRYNCQATAIVEDDQGMLWIGSKGRGLYRFDRAKEQFTLLVNHPNDPFSLSDAGILAVYIDRAGDLWLGTHGYGINKYSRSRKAFQHYVRTPAFPRSLANRSVRAIYEDEQGVLWIGGYDGLESYDRKAGKIIHYPVNSGNPSGLPGKEVFAIYPDPASGGKIFFIGIESEQGLVKFDLAAKRFTPYPLDPAGWRSLIRHPVYTIHRERSGILWVGTDNGLFKYDEAKKELRQFKHDANNPEILRGNRVLELCEDATGALWVGTEGGLHRFDREAGRFALYQHDPRNAFSLSHNRVKCIFAGRDGTLWIGTSGGGLNRFDRERERFVSYTTKDGLPNDVVYGILEDEAGNLWLSTNKGLSKFNPRTLTFRNYEVGDGLQGNEFNTGAYFKSAATPGEMFFGGINGVTAFYPEQIKDNAYVPPIVLTGFSKFNQPARLDTAITAIKKIVLDHADAVFSLQFAALNFTAPEKNQYAFRLEGFHKDWIALGAKREATFTQLDPGEYTLHLKGSNNDGVWNETGISVAIVIVPLFYQTQWFAALGVFMLGFVVYAGHRWRLHRLETRQAELERAVAEHTEALRESEQRFRQLAENITEVFWMYDLPANRMLYISPAHEKIWGAPRESLYQNPRALLNAVHEEDRGRVLAALEQQKRGALSEVEYRIVRPDGKIRWIRDRAFPVRDAGNKVYRIAGIAEDVTERKWAVDELSATSTRLLALMENLPSGILYEDEHRRVLYTNPRFCQMFGLAHSPADLAGTESSRALNAIKNHFSNAGNFAHELEDMRRASQLVANEELELLDGRSFKRDYVPISAGGKPAGHLWLFRDITKHKQMSETLRKSEELYRLLYNHTPVMMHSINLAGELVNVNDYWLKVMGYAREEVIGKPATSFLTEASRQHALNVTLPRFFETGITENIERQWIKKSGEIINVLLSAVAIRNDRGEVERSLAFLVDITARKRAEQALQESQERYRLLYDDNPAMYFTVDPQGKIVSVNRFGAEQLGYAVEELIGESVLAVFHNEDKARAQEHLSTCLQNPGASFSWELRKVRREGSLLWVKETARATRSAGGNLMVLIICDDITERKQTEQALQQSEMRYRTLVENSPDAIYVHREGKVLYANLASARLIGAASPEQLIGKSVIEFVAPAHRAAVAERMRRVVQEGITLPFTEVQGIRLDGTLIQAETMGLPIIYQGRPAAQVIVRDITARKNLEAQLRQYTENLEKLVEERAARIHELEKQHLETEKLAATGRMAARIAHEINNPLGIIHHAFRLVGRAVPAGHRHHAHVGRIEKEIERIAQIVRQMLDLHRPHVETPRTFRVDETLADVVGLLRPKAQECHVQIELDSSRACAPVSLPENMLRQILNNVILNAVEASPPQGVVRVAAEIASQHLSLTVSDQGPGIPAEIGEKIFEPFFTTKSKSAATGGMGLGLSISKNLVEAMHGEITHASDGTGATFRMVIPNPAKN